MNTTKTTNLICEQGFKTRDGAGISVLVRRSKERFAVSIHWPAGMDSAPSVKWFDSEVDAMAGYLVACQWVRSRYAA